MHKKNIDKFFYDLSILTGNMDIGSIKQMYYALVKHIVKNTVAEGKYRVPDFGEFRIISYKVRKRHNVNKEHKGVVDFPPFNSMKFRPDEKLKSYLNDRIPRYYKAREGA